MNFDAVTARLLEQGAAQVGFSNLTGLLPERYSSFQYAVTLLYKLSNGVIDEVENTGTPTFAYFHHYRTVNAFLDREALWLASLIEREGFKAMPVAASQSVKDMGEYTGIFQHKTAAVQAGLGWIGKSALFISPKFGPRVRLVTVLTDMPLPLHNSGNQVGKSRCGECRKCVNACPAMAIKGENYIPGKSQRSDVFDPVACSEHMKSAYKNIGRGAVCGICMAVCPYGKQIKST